MNATFLRMRGGLMVKTKASDSGSRGLWFEPYVLAPSCVLEQDTICKYSLYRYCYENCLFC